MNFTNYYLHISSVHSKLLRNKIDHTDLFFLLLLILLHSILFSLLSSLQILLPPLFLLPASSAFHVDSAPPPFSPNTRTDDVSLHLESEISLFSWYLLSVTWLICKTLFFFTSLCIPHAELIYTEDGRPSWIVKFLTLLHVLFQNELKPTTVRYFTRLLVPDTRNTSSSHQVRGQSSRPQAKLPDSMNRIKFVSLATLLYDKYFFLVVGPGAWRAGKSALKPWFISSSALKFPNDHHSRVITLTPHDITRLAI